MIYPKYCIYKSTKEKIKIEDVDFDSQVVIVSGFKEDIYALPFKEIDFDYSDMDLDDMYVFLRALYSPKEVVQKLCEARGIE